MCPPTSLGIGLARVGQADQVIVAGTLAELAGVDFGPPLHSLVLVGGPLHDLETAMFEHVRWRPGRWPVWAPAAAAAAAAGADSGSEAEDSSA